jgi:allophanate hydrolase subunit 1
MNLKNKMKPKDNKELRELEREIRELKASRRKLAEIPVFYDDSEETYNDDPAGWVGVDITHNPHNLLKCNYKIFRTKEEAIQSWIKWSEK